jgi:hypothetical protein
MRDVFTSLLQDCITRDRCGSRRQKSLIFFAAAVVPRQWRSSEVAAHMVTVPVAARAVLARRIIREAAAKQV